MVTSFTSCAKSVNKRIISLTDDADGFNALIGKGVKVTKERESHLPNLLSGQPVDSHGEEESQTKVMCSGYFCAQ